jgi:hypothetical protein
MPCSGEKPEAEELEGNFLKKICVSNRQEAKRFNLLRGCDAAWHIHIHIETGWDWDSFYL